ncbi:MAG: hypothetical protein WBE76_16500 [Terracidiphilus sp.]
MNGAAIGLRAHSGWTAMVAVALDEGVPWVLWRGRPHLVETFTFEFRQPYHTAEKVPIGEARGVIARARDEAARLARNAIATVLRRAADVDCDLTGCGLLLASGRPLPSLERILASHALIHTADGELFRDALVAAAKGCGLEMFTIRESEVVANASRELGMKPDAILRRVARLGAELGPPWAQDEKLAALAAWMALIHRNVPAARG